MKLGVVGLLLSTMFIGCDTAPPLCKELCDQTAAWAQVCGLAKYPVDICKSTYLCGGWVAPFTPDSCDDETLQCWQALNAWRVETAQAGGKPDAHGVPTEIVCSVAPRHRGLP
jgi:hypothetical protein